MTLIQIQIVASRNIWKENCLEDFGRAHYSRSEDELKFESQNVKEMDDIEMLGFYAHAIRIDLNKKGWKIAPIFFGKSEIEGV